MDKMLKGNYELENPVDLEANKQIETISELFEHQAMHRLGGSIAFVMKGNKLVWDEEEGQSGIPAELPADIEKAADDS